MLPGVLKASIPADIPRLNDAELNLAVVGFMAGAAVLTAFLFSLAPAWQVSTLSLTNALNDAGASAGVSRRRTRQGLVVVEIALAFILLAGAGLMTWTLIAYPFHAALRLAGVANSWAGGL